MRFSLNMREWDTKAYINLKKKKKDFMEDTRCEVERTTVERFTE